MITTYEEYRKNYIDLLNSNGTIPVSERRMVNPQSEPKFTIDANTRKIIIPKEFEKGVAVYKDYKSETLFFEIDRYFDDVDLMDKTCVIQFINSENMSMAIGASLKYLSEDNLKVIVGWQLTHDVTAKEGPVTFSIRFYSLENKNTLSYNWSTLPATVNIYSGLYVMEGTETIPNKTTLELLLDQINSLWANGSPSMDYNNLKNLPHIGNAYLIGDISELILGLMSGDTSSKKFLTVSDILLALDKDSINPVASKTLWSKFENQDLSLTDLSSSIEALKEEMDGMSFVPITIEEFTILPPTVGATASNQVLVENGQRIADIRFAWKLNRDPVSLHIDDNLLNFPSMEGEIPLSYDPPIVDNRKFTLTVGDKKGEPIKAYANLIFCNNAYWGVRDLVTNEEITEGFIKDAVMERRLTIDKEMSFNVNITDGKYLYVALPISLGAPFQFSVDGLLKGGFDYIKTMELPCANDSIAEYMIYRSTNPSLGNVQILIS